MSGILIDVLDPRLVGAAHGQIPALEGSNKFRGIFDWNKKDDSILAPTIYSKTEGVKRKITTVEMA